MPVVLIPVDHDPFERLAANGGPGVYRGGQYDDFRRSENVEDRRRKKYSADPFIEDPNYKREWLEAADIPPTALGASAGAGQVREAFDSFSRDRLAAERAEYERRKAAGELVFDSRFDPPLSEQGMKYRMVPVDHDPFAEAVK